MRFTEGPENTGLSSRQELQEGKNHHCYTDLLAHQAIVPDTVYYVVPCPAWLALHERIPEHSHHLTALFFHSWTAMWDQEGHRGTHQGL